MIENTFNKYYTTPICGFIPKDFIKFKDKELFGEESRKNIVLKKISIWYGTPMKIDKNIKGKGIIGIECTHKNRQDNSITKQKYCGDLSNNDFEFKEIELKKEVDFFSDFYLSFNGIITYIKLTSFFGEIFEMGKIDDDNQLAIPFKDKEQCKIIKFFKGFYNNSGLMALGVDYKLLNNCIPSNVTTILKLIKIIKTNDNAKKKFNNPIFLEKLSFEMRTIAKIVILPDILFSSILKYLIE
jgi:hypothetical protein